MADEMTMAADLYTWEVTAEDERARKGMHCGECDHMPLPWYDIDGKHADFKYGWCEFHEVYVKIHYDACEDFRRA